MSYVKKLIINLEAAFMTKSWWNLARIFILKYLGQIWIWVMPVRKLGQEATCMTQSLLNLVRMLFLTYVDTVWIWVMCVQKLGNHANIWSLVYLELGWVLLLAFNMHYLFNRFYVTNGLNLFIDVNWACLKVEKLQLHDYICLLY